MVDEVNKRFWTSTAKTPDKTLSSGAPKAKLSKGRRATKKPESESELNKYLALNETNSNQQLRLVSSLSKNYHATEKDKKHKLKKFKQDAQIKELNEDLDRPYLSLAEYLVKKYSVDFDDFDRLAELRVWIRFQWNCSVGSF